MPARITEVVFVEPLAVRVGTAAEMVEVATCTMYKLIREGKVETTGVGADLRVLVPSLKQMLAKRASAKK